MTTHNMSDESVVAPDEKPERRGAPTGVAGRLSLSQAVVQGTHLAHEDPNDA
jgi:hypothetical protein